MIVDCNPRLVFLFEHFYDCYDEGVVNALRGPVKKLVSLLLDPLQVHTHIGIA